MFGNSMVVVIIVGLAALFLGSKMFSRNGLIAIALVAAVVIGGGAILRWLNKFDGPGFAFYEGNGASQDNVCNITDQPASLSLKNHDDCPNDEIRSARLLGIAEGTTLKVFDNPDGKLEDDWAQVVALKDIDEYVLSSFEKSMENESVRVHYSRNNGLDGKISLVRSLLQAPRTNSDLLSPFTRETTSLRTKSVSCRLWFLRALTSRTTTSATTTKLVPR